MIKIVDFSMLYYSIVFNGYSTNFFQPNEPQTYYTCAYSFIGLNISEFIHSLYNLAFFGLKSTKFCFINKILSEVNRVIVY